MRQNRFLRSTKCMQCLPSAPSAISLTYEKALGIVAQVRITSLALSDVEFGICTCPPLDGATVHFSLKEKQAQFSGIPNEGAVGAIMRPHGSQNRGFRSRVLDRRAIALAESEGRMK